MQRTNLYIKIELEHQDQEQPERLGEEICRQVRKIYGVRSAEVSSITPDED
jgi:hypothetical protein